MQTVYVDILVFLNTVIDCVLLLIAAAIGGRKPVRWRLVAASFLGGGYSLILLLPALSGPVLTLSRLLSAAVITAVAFPFRSLRAFLYQWGLFYLAGFLFAGLMTALWFVFTPPQMMLGNGVVYFHLQPAVLIVGVLAVYLLIRLLFRHLRGFHADRERVVLTLTNALGQAKTVAVTDTGNRLHDPFGGEPVILLSAQAAGPILDPAVRDYLRGGENAAVRALEKGVRLIPYEGVGKQGLLPLVRVDSVEKWDGSERTVCERAKIAVTDQQFFEGGCGALLHPDLVFIRHKPEQKGGKKSEQQSERHPSFIDRAFFSKKQDLLHQRTGKPAAAFVPGGRGKGLCLSQQRPGSERKTDRT